MVGRAAYEVVARCPYVNDILIYDPQKNAGPVDIATILSLRGVVSSTRRSNLASPLRLVESSEVSM